MIPKYRIIFDDNGQTCNRFWGYIDSVAWAVLNKKKVFILHWDKNIRHFNRLRKNKHVSFPLYSEKRVKKYGDEQAQKRIYWLIDNTFFYWLFANVHSIMGIVQIVRGWKTRNKTDLHQKAGRLAYDLFIPNDDIVSEVKTIFEEVKKTSDVIVGLHIRKGDYKTWLDGKYYYEDEEYESLMAQIEKNLSSKRVAFFIATNGEVSKLITEQHQTFRINDGNMAHDLYGLSLCDYIIGPPSTFSKWAALVGYVPLYHVYDTNKPISTNDFSYENALSPWNN